MEDKANKKFPAILKQFADAPFFLIIFLYLWLIIDMKLIYFGGAMITRYPEFFTGFTFFKEFLAHPGGLNEYAAAFFAQMLHFSLLGALVITLYTLAVSFLTSKILRIIKLDSLSWLKYALPIIMIVPYGQYTTNIVTVTAFLVSLSFAFLYIAAASAKITIRSAAFLLMSVTVYWLIGAPFFLFVIIAAVYEIRLYNKPNYTHLLALLIPWFVAVKALYWNVRDAYTYLLPIHGNFTIYQDIFLTRLVTYALYLAIPVTLLLTMLAGKFSLIKLPQNNSLAKLFKKTSQRKIAIIILIVVSFVSLNKKRQTIFQAGYYAYHEQWDRLPKCVEKRPNNLVIGGLNTLGLYHQDKLLYDMFAFRQASSVLFIKSKVTEFLEFSEADIYFYLGYVNMAEHKWSTALDGYGERPMILKRLALINMIKGNTGSARVYLESLKRTLFDKNYAYKYLPLIDNENLLSQDPMIKKYRSFMVDDDKPMDHLSAELLLKTLFQNNSKNKMAYEYLMAWFLLTKQVDGIADYANYLSFYGYEKLPPYIEDAVLLYQTKSSKKANLGNFKISRDAVVRFQEFSQLQRQYPNDIKRIYDASKDKFGNSYLFYYLFSRSGLKKIDK